jgi:hypothetical protein
MMIRVCRSLFVLALAGAAGCAGNRGARPGEPDAASDRWRDLAGCYNLGDEQVVLDTLPETRLNAGRAGIRRARFAPRPAIVGAYWYVERDGDLWLLRNDGLWGMSYEFQAAGDSLVGVRWTGTDVPEARPEPVRAVAVRSASCPAPDPAAS